MSPEIAHARYEHVNGQKRIRGLVNHIGIFVLISFESSQARAIEFKDVAAQFRIRCQFIEFDFPFVIDFKPSFSPKFLRRLIQIFLLKILPKFYSPFRSVSLSTPLTVISFAAE